MSFRIGQFFATLGQSDVFAELDDEVSYYLLGETLILRYISHPSPIREEDFH
jgi:hypothetical protein